MKNDQIVTMTESFEGHAQQTENGIEYWLARDLQHLLGYTEWENSQYCTKLLKSGGVCFG